MWEERTFQGAIEAAQDSLRRGMKAIENTGFARSNRNHKNMLGARLRGAFEQIRDTAVYLFVVENCVVREELIILYKGVARKHVRY